ncbi:MAG: acyl-CoA desaturase, partial [Pseudomonadota bacterium]
MVKQLTEKQLESLARDLDEIRDEAMAQVGEYDARYIRKILRLQRLTEVGGRGLLFMGFNPLAW